MRVPESLDDDAGLGLATRRDGLPAVGHPSWKDVVALQVILFLVSGRADSTPTESLKPLFLHGLDESRAV